MAKQQTDDELNLRRKARRRLVGASALTLAVVVILPMVLDREPGLAGKDIDLSIPSPDKVSEFIPGAAVSEVAATTPAAAVSPAVVAAPPQAPDVKKPSAIPVQQASTGNAAAHKPSEAKKPAEANIADKSAGAEGFVAQVGAYSNPSTARQELNKLKKWGFKAYTEKSGDKIRVRVGPYPEREKAEKAGRLLEKHGMHPVILSAK